MRNSYLHYPFSRSGVAAFIVFGLFLIGTGSLYLYNRPFNLIESLPVGALFIFLGLGLVLVSEGVQIDPKQERYRQYFQVFMIKLGKWNPYTSNNDILCLRSREKHVGYSEKMEADIEFSGPVKYEVYLADRNHFHLTLLKSSSSNLDAEYEADYIAEQLGLKWVQYNPGRRRPGKILGGIKDSGNPMKLAL